MISIFHGASLQSKDSIFEAKNLPPLKRYKSVAVNSLSSKYSILTLPPIYYVTRAEEFRTVRNLKGEKNKSLKLRKSDIVIVITSPNQLPFRRIKINQFDWPAIISERVNKSKAISVHSHWIFFVVK